MTIFRERDNKEKGKVKRDRYKTSVFIRKKWVSLP